MGAKVHPGGKKPPPMTGNEAHVFVKSPNAERAKQLCAIAEKCGFASSIHPDTDKCLEELGQLMKDNEGTTKRYYCGHLRRKWRRHGG